jgi:hypothetical protein
MNMRVACGAFGAALAMLVAACSASERAPAADSTVTEDSAAGIVAIGSGPYAVTAVEQPGTLTGTATSDSTSTTADRDPRHGCAGDSSAVASELESETVVWIDGPRAGKQLPVERRYELTSEDCAFEPRVQAVVVGGAVNVFNDDRGTHRLVFLRMGTRDTLQVMPFTAARQLVATDRLTREPGFVEVRCVQHPWSHAIIAVFDHPYFTVIPGDAPFTIESVPAGDYTVMSWAEGMRQPLSRTVTVAPGANVQVPLPH